MKFGLDVLSQSCQQNRSLVKSLCEAYHYSFLCALQRAQEALDAPNLQLFQTQAMRFQKDCSDLDVDFGAVVVFGDTVSLQSIPAMREWVNDMKAKVEEFERYVEKELA